MAIRRFAPARESNSADWPVEPGVYALLLETPEPLVVQVGRLRRYTLAPGRYAYIGSAHGGGGLRARISRHLRPIKPQHWHIDALTAALPVVSVLLRPGPRPLECAWVRRFLTLPGARAPVTGFGSSDCRNGCPAHLVQLPDGFDWQNWEINEDD